MLRRTSQRLLQRGVHVSHTTVYHGAKMKQWPAAKIPKNFSMTNEQRWKMEPLPRDVGLIPRNFVLNVVYQHQPCEVEKLWEMCAEDTTTVLDSKRHLRAVLKQCREEGFIYFEKDAVTDGWICILARERFEEVKEMAKMAAQNTTPSAVSVLRGSAVAETAGHAEKFNEFSQDEQAEHLKRLEEAVAATNEAVRRYQRTEVDYLPYTDLNGKVDFMWWYDVRDASSDKKFAELIAASEQPSAIPALPKPEGL